ncbi:angiogenin-2-like [Paroedura picta]|uniref:angiogenin-2-like n=1 Tax=Paroedura picta TaxID=143630 RepID=UPI001014B3C0
MTSFRRFALILLAFRVTVATWDNSPGEKNGFLHFLKQHFIPDFVSLEGVDCNSLMSGSFFTRGNCKEVNTYIITFPDHLQAICEAKGKPYDNLRRSLERFDLLTCTLEGDPTQKICNYNLHRFSAFIAVSCDRYGYPVHLEEDDFEDVIEGEVEESPTWYKYFLTVFG